MLTAIFVFSLIAAIGCAIALVQLIQALRK